MLELLEPYATIIRAVSALISAVAVLISTGFVIWTTCFRKTRRDRIDELKEEIQVSLERTVIQPSEIQSIFESLNSKYNKHEYKKLHHLALNELSSENKVKVIWTR